MMENYNTQQNGLVQQQNNDTEGVDISLRSIWKFFTGNWFWFLISVVICLGVGMFYCTVSPKIYSSSALIYIDENASRSVKSDVTSMTNFRMMRQTSVVDNEAAILRSITLMERVAENLDLNVIYKKPSKLRKVEVYAPNMPAHVVVDSLMRGFTMDLNLAQESVSGLIKFSMPDGEKREMKFSSEYDKPIYGDMGIIRVVKNERYADDYAAAIDKNDKFLVGAMSIRNCARALASSLTVAPLSKTTSIISVGIKSGVPQKSADIVNELIYVYNEDAKEGERAVARATMQFVDERLAIVGSDLEDVDSDVANYRKNTKSVNSQSEATLYVQTASRLEGEAVELETQISILGDVLASVKAVSGNVELVPNLGVSDSSLNAMIVEYNDAVLRYKMMGGDSNLSNPSVASAREQVLSIQALLPQSIKNLQGSLEVRLRSVNRQIAENEEKVSALPSVEKGAQSILRNQQIKAKIYDYLLNKREETSLKLATTAPVSRVIDPALPATNPISPRTIMIMLLALIMGFVIPVVVIFVAEALRTKIYSVEEVEVAIGNDVPIVGAIPSKDARHTSDIMVTPNSRDSIAEAFRMVRTNIDFMMPNGGKVIMTTSTIPAEGKTTIALNIALSFVITGKKVVIVDMDMRKGSMEKRINAKHHSKGIVSYLMGQETDVDNLIVKDCVHGVDALFVGTIPPNPAELLMRPEIDAMFEELKQRYDYIIVDTAPIALVTDTQIINRLADITLYCMRMGHTEKVSLDTVKAISNRKSLNNLGVIVSQVGVGKLYYGGEKKSTNFGYGYGYGYGYGANDGKKMSAFKQMLSHLKKNKE